MSHIRGRAAGLLTAATLAAGLAAATVPAASAATAAPARPAVSAALGACNILIEGQTRVVGGVTYVCVHIRGIGWLWVREQFWGCAATRAARLCG